MSSAAVPENLFRPKLIVSAPSLRIFNPSQVIELPHKFLDHGALGYRSDSGKRYPVDQMFIEDLL